MKNKDLILDFFFLSENVVDESAELKKKYQTLKRICCTDLYPKCCGETFAEPCTVHK